ncbi:hypothetical protein BV898_01190 [Hypsibius exemplaris]|uniref:Receptor ligand binding region domain-containing protein n=1 Tax=Hypsibius exemplaris TaxID=2072580 RepID=A0A1W0XCJ5_HYPEX|nr:hypothetical protein BV898_01190 [Hypsibius exemplaris]
MHLFIICHALLWQWFFTVKVTGVATEKPTSTNTDQSVLHIEFVTTGFFGFNSHEPVSLGYNATAITTGLPRLRALYHQVISLTYNAPAIITGVQRLRDLYPQHWWTSTFLTDPHSRTCPLMLANVYFMLSQWYYSRENTGRLSIIVTPGSKKGAFHSSASEPAIRNRQLSPTWLSTTPFASPNVVFCSLLNNLNWRTVVASLDTDSDAHIAYYTYAFNRVVGKLTECSVKFSASSLAYSDGLLVSKLLGEFHQKTRVFLYFGLPSGLRILLIAAVARNMTNGDYVYLAVVPWSSSSFGYFTWQSYQDDDEKVKEAYRSVLLLSLVDETQYGSPSIRNLAQKWANISQCEYNNTEPPNYLPIPLMTATQTAVEMAGIAAMEALARSTGLSNGDNGQMLADSIRNRTYPNLQTGLWRMSGGGEMLHIVQLASFDWQEGQLKVFMKGTEIDCTDIYIWERTSTTSESIWHGGSALPPALPLCGLDGDACSSGRPWVVLATGSSSAVLVTLAGTISLFVQMTIIRQRRRLWWILELQSFIPGTAKEISIYGFQY